ncbi:G5 and 3D domain-containing protein [Coprothermobacter platensis]|uniref:G5 and 3D domain-containing protein n=1 Tax=Coprothermobacter platensis TaxID=108819 RepID=UPI0003626F24|nr:3D domain-containing protein [Coprothermobacter platensis]
MKLFISIMLLLTLSLSPVAAFTKLPIPTQTVSIQGKTLKVTSPYTDKNILNVINAQGNNYQVKKQGNILLVQNIEVTTKVNYVYIPPKVVVQPSSVVAKGKTAILSQGSPTVKAQTWQIKSIDGKVVNKTLVNEKIVRQGTNKVIALGQSAYRGEAQEILMVATAYSAEEAGVGTRTAIGTRARYGVVAVDPNVIPLGTKLYIEGYGYAIAEDIGGSIKGNRIDVYFNTIDECYRWGRRVVKVYILGKD